MSPEVAARENYGDNVDIWALGVLLFEMTHGFTPFYSKN